MILISYQRRSASKISHNFSLRCEVKCKYLLMNTWKKITIANFIGRTPVFPGGQGLKTSEKNKEKKKRKN